jgi:hypothetical protein
VTRRRWRIRLTRDLALFSTALGLLTYEVTLGGARPEVLTVCTSLLLAPAVLNLGDRRRDRDGDE